MAFVKCPRCELNYILDGEKLCTVCRKEVRGESEQDEIAELCSECGENPVVPGSELCLSCLKEMSRRISEANADDTVVPEDPALEIDSVSTMDEIDIGDDIEGDEAFKGEDFEDEDEEAEDEEEGENGEKPSGGKKRRAAAEDLDDAFADEDEE